MTTAFDPDALHARYIAERDKRLRPDGLDQYIELSAIAEDVDRDPYVEPGFTRPALVEQIDVCIIGAGFGGMMAAVELARRGIRNIRMIDKAGDFGGTWYWNRYPGAACDIESYIYLPYLEETGYMPVEKYSKATEIFGHAQRIGRHFDLYPMALFQTHVDDLRWDEAEGRWHIRTDRGDDLAARFTIIAGGVLHKAKLPGIPGIETFKGHQFHTSRWDYDYTGGSPTTPLDKLADKKVAIIGTGATAVQVVPSLGEYTGQLYVCQRTPSAVGIRGNQPTDPAWAASLQPGWQQARMDNFTAVVSGDPFDEDLVGDGWTDIFRELQAFGAGRTDVSADEQQLADYRKMEELRQRIDDTVADPATAEALKPWYNRMCKRPCFHDEYLEAFNRPNVTLLDTDGKGVERITASSVVVQGKEYPVDCIIYASGFEMATDYHRRLGFDVHGHGGRSMRQDWAEHGPHTLHGMFSRGYPNLVMFSPTQGIGAINFVHSTYELAQHAAEVISACIREGVAVFEPTAEAEEAWWNEVAQYLMKTALFLSECTPGYYNGEGARDMSRIKMATYQGGTMRYVNLLRAWRSAGDMAGLEKKQSVAA